MKFYIVTTFPESIAPYIGSSLLRRAQEKGKISVSFVNPRDFTADVYKKTDDIPYGGGPGMVLKAEPIVLAVTETLSAEVKIKNKHIGIFIMSPRGKQFTQKNARDYAKKYDIIVLIAGHYEGIDARVRKILKAKEISVGPYVLTGGEIPAALIVDAVSRHIKGVLGDPDSVEEKHVASRDVYTRPDVFEWKGKRYAVPKVLRSGNHAAIRAWRESH
mgnify:CR=1 FL=1|jgi:tRNA (guanine37-N1)-methyltransferase